TGATPVSAVTLSLADGVWLNGTSPDGSTPTCLFYVNSPPTNDENRVTFGTPSALGNCPSASSVAVQSGFGFDGNSAIQFSPGTVFVLGELTHYNNPIYRFVNLSQVDLGIDLMFSSPSISTRLDYTILLDETDNVQDTCPYGDTVPCADRVEIVSPPESQEFNINGTQYVLDIVGFVPGSLGSCQYDADNVITSFISDEQDSNSACLFARFLNAEPALAINKTGTTGPLGVGQTVDYVITVSNIGDVVLTGVTVTDPMLNINRSLGQLEPGESVEIEDSYFITASNLPGPLINTATADSIETDPVQDSHNVTLRTTAGLIVTKVVDWAGIEPNQTTIFRICVSGPSFASPDCSFIDWDGGELVYEGLEPGVYTVTESDPGVNWAVTGSGASVEVVAGETDSLTIVNRYTAPGSLSVFKNVNWNDHPVDDAKQFSICAQGPSYPTPACQMIGAGGGILVWQNLVPGNYTVTEEYPGDGWSVSGSGAVVTVPHGGNAATTITNSYDPAVVAVCENPNPSLDLVGVLLPETGFNTGRVTNNSSECAYDIGIASYLKYDEIIDNQDLFAFNTVRILPGQTLEISVGLPDCATQVDLFHGAVLPSLNGMRYGPRLLAAIHLHNTYCVNADAPIEEVVPPVESIEVPVIEGTEEVAPPPPAESTPEAEATETVGG
ncbi:MAG: choice-of-anchor K domain-containing protein, partial [Aggregatilineales bacterium]